MKKSAVVLIYNSKQELALQLRAAEDDSYPMHWDFSAAGGIHDDEDPKAAAERELAEEIGVENEVSFEDTVLFRQEDLEDFLYIYTALHDGSFAPDEEEVAEVKFFSLKEISEMLQRGEKFHPEFVFLWNQGFFKNLSFLL